MPDYYVRYGVDRRYGCANFALDAFMTIITQGLWIIWIVIRQYRRRS